VIRYGIGGLAVGVALCVDLHITGGSGV
jgi:hypothetical protein